MAISVVQNTGKQQADNTGDPNIPFGSNVTSGNTLFLLIVAYDDEPAVSDNLNGSWTKDKSQLTAAGTNLYASLYRFSNTAAGACTITIDYAGSSNYMTAGALEVSGLDTSSPLDQSSANSDNDTAPNHTDITTTQADEIVMAVMSLRAGGSQGVVVPSGYTTVWTENNANAHNGGGGCYKILSSTGTESPDWAINNTTDSGLVLASYKMAAAASFVGEEDEGLTFKFSEVW